MKVVSVSDCQISQKQSQDDLKLFRNGLPWVPPDNSWDLKVNGFLFALFFESCFPVSFSKTPKNIKVEFNVVFQEIKEMCK